jgi:hypothetical protein
MDIKNLTIKASLLKIACDFAISTTNFEYSKNDKQNSTKEQYSASLINNYKTAYVDLIKLSQDIAY